MVTQSLGVGRIMTDQEGYLKLVDFYERCIENNDPEILVAFENLEWFDANMSALLMAILQKLQREKEASFFVDPEVIKERFSILLRNGLVEGVEFEQTNNKSAIKLTGFKPDEDQRFIGYIEQELLSHNNLVIDKTVKGKLVDAFCELFSNVQKHARTLDPIFACGQYYPRLKRLCFTLVDSGVGYFLPINEYTGGSVSSSGDAILWALKGNTTKMDAPGGLGLQEIQKFCSESGSRFSIITGGEYWINNELFTIPVKHFCGTIVNVIFDCKRQ